MSIKLIKDALQWNEHPNKTEQAGRTTRHNEYDAGTEIEKKSASELLRTPILHLHGEA
jgi:hypothetical protein